MNTNLLWVAIAWTVMVAPTALAQKDIEVTPFIGGQINTGLDLSTARFNGLDVQNGINYGVSVGYLIGNYAGVEFMRCGYLFAGVSDEEWPLSRSFLWFVHSADPFRQLFNWSERRKETQGRCLFGLKFYEYLRRREHVRLPFRSLFHQHQA